LEKFVLFCFVLFRSFNLKSAGRTSQREQIVQFDAPRELEFLRRPPGEFDFVIRRLILRLGQQSPFVPSLGVAFIDEVVFVGSLDHPFHLCELEAIPIECSQKCTVHKIRNVFDLGQLCVQWIHERVFRLKIFRKVCFKRVLVTTVDEKNQKYCAVENRHIVE
jgi:hypothetical protein